MRIESLKALIGDVPDFPHKGILFRDISPLLAAPNALASAAMLMAEHLQSLKQPPTVIAGPESRGFIFGVALAQHLSLGFVPIRKQGKLPRAVYRQGYALEYGEDALEVHQDAFKKSDRVLLVDDLLATGGTAEACVALVQKVGAQLAGASFVIELQSLKVRKRLAEVKVNTLIQYP